MIEIFLYPHVDNGKSYHIDVMKCELIIYRNIKEQQLKSISSSIRISNGLLGFIKIMCM